MQTLKVDTRKRVLLTGAKPGQVFARTDNGDGSITLVPVKAERKEPFPPGSLSKYFSGELGRKRDKEETEIASGCLQGPM